MWTPLGKHGTASVVMPQNMMGTLPTRNYNEGQFELCGGDQRRDDDRHAS